MQRRIASLFTAIFVLSTFLVTAPLAAPAHAHTTETYWSDNAAPVMYGTTEAVIKVGDRFSLSDAAYRVFARDFEDGDVTPEIIYSGAVVPTTDQHLVAAQAAGNTYAIASQVADANGNTATFTTTVTVLPEDSTTPRSITKVVYNNASTWNTQLQGIMRMDGHDRQVIGLTVPVGGSINAEVLSGATPITFVANTNNEATQPDGPSITIQPGQAAELAGSTGTSTALAMKTPLNSRTEGNARKDIKVKFTFGDSTTITPYYFAGDDQDAFFADWDARQSTDPYAFIEGRRSLILTHHANDRDRLLTGISNKLDTSLEYLDTIAQRDDELIGLDVRATDPLDQQVKTKQYFRANARGAGAAYYGGDHIAVSQKFMWSLLDWGWGTLHEIGHGYQGSLGRGGNGNQFDGGETTNNLLSYYIQHNSEILDVTGHNGYWYDRALHEDKVQVNYRLSRESAEMNTVGKALLTTMIATADAAGQSPYRDQSVKDAAGREPLGVLNHWYREYLNSGKSITNESAWAMAFADEFNINILPVLDAWNVTIPHSTREYIVNRPHLDNLIFLADALGVNTDGTSQNPQLEAHMMTALSSTRFGLVRTSELTDALTQAGHPLTGHLTVEVQNNGITPSTKLSENLAGKTAYLVNNGKAVAQAVFDTNAQAFVFAEVPVGAYTIQVPATPSYALPLLDAVLVTPNETSVVANYREENGIIAGSVFELKGRTWGTTALKGTLDPDHSLLQITLGGSATGCSSAQPEAADEPCVKVKITDANGNVKTYGDPAFDALWELPYGGPNNEMTIQYPDRARQNASVPVQIGDIVTVRYFLWNNSSRTVFTDAAGNVQDYNTPSAIETQYRVSPIGLLRIDTSPEAEAELVATVAKTHIANAVAQLSEEVLNDPLASTAAKAAIIQLIATLPQENQAEYATLLEKLNPEIAKSETPIVSKPEENPVSSENTETPEDQQSPQDDYLEGITAAPDKAQPAIDNALPKTGFGAMQITLLATLCVSAGVFIAIRIKTHTE